MEWFLWRPCSLTFWFFFWNFGLRPIILTETTHQHRSKDCRLNPEITFVPIFAQSKFEINWFNKIQKIDRNPSSSFRISRFSPSGAVRFESLKYPGKFLKIGNEIASSTGNGAYPQLHNQLIEIKPLVENQYNFDTSLWFLGKVINFWNLDFKFDKSKFDYWREN